MASNRCSHSPPLSSRPALCDLEPILHPPRTAPARHRQLCLSHAGEPPTQSGRLFGSSMLAIGRATHGRANRVQRCKLCMPTLPPPVTRRPQRPMGGRTWPLGCGRVAGLGRLQVNHIAKGLCSIVAITNRSPNQRPHRMVLEQYGQRRRRPFSFSLAGLRGVELAIQDFSSPGAHRRLTF